VRESLVVACARTERKIRTAPGLVRSVTEHTTPKRIHPRLTEDWNRGVRSAACHHAERSTERRNDTTRQTKYPCIMCRFYRNVSTGTTHTVSQHVNKTCTNHKYKQDNRPHTSKKNIVIDLQKKAEESNTINKPKRSRQCNQQLVLTTGPLRMAFKMPKHVGEHNF
jgi:hypothetical protein